MNFKNLVVRMMAVLVLAGVVLAGATPSKAAEATENTETIIKQEQTTTSATETATPTPAPQSTQQVTTAEDLTNATSVQTTTKKATTKKTTTKKTTTKKTTTKKTTTKKSYTKKELKLMSAIIYCEAGNQSMAGKIAVGIVVMNRKSSSKFPNTIEKVLKQSYQFTPVRTGKWAREMKKYSQGKYKTGARAKCVKAAKAALEGQKTVTYKGKKINMKKYHFFSQYLKKAKLRIGGHDFK
ncbi:MAG: cell wall hydrolase [Eubacterium sp.]|nr:cell wall hydrolase [Eubacterium sp.]